MENLINLDSLSEEEKSLILSVIKRDEELKHGQDSKIAQLKIEIHNLRKQSILRGEDNSNKICIRCRKQFGFFFDTGEICTHCKYKICNMCRETLVSGGWLCTLCYKQMQLKWMTGEWIYGTTKKCPRYMPSGGDVIKASIRRSTSNRNIARTDDNVDGGAGISKSSSAISSRDNLDRITSPQESDKMRLSHLFSSFKSGKADVPDSEVSVQHISCRRRVDSDTDSSDDERPVEMTKAASIHSSVALSEHGNSLPKQQVSSETESMTDSPRIPNSPRIPKKNVVVETSVPSILENGHSLAGDDGCEYSTSCNLSEHQSLLSNSTTTTTTPSAKENGSSLKNEKEEQFLHTANISSMPITVLTPIVESKVQQECKQATVQRTSSGKSDASSVSLTSTRTASPRTKIRLLDMASRRALERDSSDHEECGSHSSQNGSEVVGKHLGDIVVEGSSKLCSLPHSKKSDSSFQGKHSSLAPHVKVTSETGSDETGSHGGDSGHISGTSAENTPEHKPRCPQHLSIPSLVCTSADENDHEDDEHEDIDDLVCTLHPRNTLRSHLTDSRESLYSIYSDAGEINYGKIPVTGEILFGLDYNYKSGALEIYIKQCKDLAPVDTKRNRSDPYVKTYLLPDKTRSGKRKTKIKKHTLNPKFDEVIRYVISKSEIENRVLWVTVWHNDRFGRNDFLGEVMISLECYKFGDSAPRWYLLQERLELPESSLCYKGDLVMSLKYVTSDKIDSPSKKEKSKKIKETSKGELHVFVKESRNLTAVRSNGTSDPFCKGYLLPEKNKSVKQKTPVVKRNCSPEWNHIFLFEDVSLEELAGRSLELTVWDHDRITSNDFLGGVRLNLGTGAYNGLPVEWMDAHGQEVYIWKSMLERPNTWVNVTVGLRHTMGKSEIKK